MTNRNPYRTAILTAALLLCAPLAASAADVQSVGVHAGDLNLATDAGRAVLQQRIAHAVDAVCGMSHPRTAGEAQAYAACSKTARAGTATQYDTMVAAARDGQKMMAGGKAAPVLQ